MSKFSVYSFYVCAVCLFVLTPLLAQEQPAIPQQVLDWQKAAQSSAQNNSAQAISQYQQIIQTFPNTPYAFDAWVQIARLNVQIKNFGQVQSAVTQLFTIYRDQPGVFQAVFGVVKKCMYANAHPEAISICTEVKNQLASHPHAALITGWLGMVYAHQGNSAQAQQMKEELLKGNITPQDFMDGMCSIGWGYFCVGEWEQALTTYRQGIERYPDDNRSACLQYHIVQTCLRKGDVEAVKAEMETLLTRYGHRDDTPGQACGLAKEFCQRGQGQQAIGVCKRLLEQFPTHKDVAGVQDLLVEIYADTGDLVKAQEAIKADIEKYPGHKGLLRMIARVAVETARAGDPNKAMELTQAIFDQKPEGTDQLYGYTTLARVYVCQGEDARAEKLVDEMLVRFKDYPKDLDNHLFDVGEEYYRKAFTDNTYGQLSDNAPAMLNKAIEFWQRPIFSEGSWQKLSAIQLSGTAYLYLGQYGAAIAKYKEAMNTDPNSRDNGNILRLMGMCYAGLAENGIGDPNQAMKLTPEQALAEAETAWQTVVGKYPDDAMSYDAAMRLAQIKEHKGQWQEAAEAYEFFLSHCGKDPREVQTTFKLGNACEQAGQKDLAREAYTEYVQTAPVGDRYIPQAAKALLRLAAAGQ